MNSTLKWVLAGAVVLLMPFVAKAQVEEAAVIEGRISYLDLASGDITVDDSAARIVGSTQIVQRGLTLSRGQLAIGQNVMLELHRPYPVDRTREIKSITILGME
ncbi:MAG: hypothetical protein DWQ11_17295 [Proteobacteria bacterium]|nr:MAG: hypothetical protein DWQ11_17295 [Pseudomonadota bacterium]